MAVCFLATFIFIIITPVVLLVVVILLVAFKLAVIVGCLLAAFSQPFFSLL